MSLSDSELEEEVVPSYTLEHISSGAEEGLELLPLRHKKGSVVPLHDGWSELNEEQLRELAGRVKTIVDFDNGRGDLTLIVRNDADNEDVGDDVKDDDIFAAFKVSSSALVRASPFWEKVFLGPFAEAQPGHAKVLNYIEDDTASLRILLDAIHLRFNKIPPVLLLSDLADMAALTDKFCATSIVGPWLPGWLTSLDDTIGIDGSEIQWIWISWEYGLEGTYERVYRKLCVNMAIDENGAPSFPGISFRSLPPTVEDKLKENRRNLIQDTMGALYRYFDELRQVAKSSIPSPDSREPNEHTNCVSYEYCKEGRLECVIAQIGSMFCGLESYGFWPEKEASEILISPHTLRETLSRIWILSYHTRILRTAKYTNYSRDPGPCSCGSFQRIIDGLSESSSHLSISKEQKARLAKQHSLWAAG